MNERTPPRKAGLGRLSGPPLIVQLIALLVGALVTAQLVTLLLTLVLPPAPPREYALADIATALRAADGASRFDRVVQSGPPDVSARGWFVSESSRAKLAHLLARPVAEVALGFYTQLPVGGAVDPVARPSRLPSDAERLRNRQVGDAAPSATASAIQDVAWAGTDPEARVDADTNDDPGASTPRLMNAALLQQMPGGPPGGGFPGGRPGGGFPGPGLPGGGFPQSLPQPRPQIQPRPPQPTVSAPTQARSPSQPQAAIGSRTAPTQATEASPGPAASAPSGTGGPPGSVPQAPGFGGGAPLSAPSTTQQMPMRPPITPIVPTPPITSAPAFNRPPQAPAAESSVEPARSQADRVATPATAPALASRSAANADAAASAAASRAREATVPTAATMLPAPAGRPVPIVRASPGLFGLAPAPFVEGDFVAGVRLPDGRWAVVSPRAEGFPNPWQRRVALWFLLSLLAVAPVAWLFARRIVGPLNDFAYAADVLGRDPGAAVLPLDGPAEIGRAAHAFNQMQSRLRSFVDDRTAMIGAISHDLRTPLTRLRFRIEDVPEDQQDALRGEVAEMEEMISSVIAFMRDASVPNARERRNFAEIVDDVVVDATLLGDVEAGRMDSAMVDIDPLGMRRVLNNLLTNAMKYGGGHARVALRVEDECAVTDIVDDGPGVPEGELDRVFEPFYRSEEARGSGREGSGLGLAVCRSIARAHGGDVALFRSAEGFTARVTLPLAYYDDRRAA